MTRRTCRREGLRGRVWNAKDVDKEWLMGYNITGTSKSTVISSQENVS